MLTSVLVLWGRQQVQAQIPEQDTGQRPGPQMRTRPNRTEQTLTSVSDLKLSLCTNPYFRTSV